MSTTQTSYAAYEAAFFSETNRRADRIMNIALWAYFAFGILLSLFYQTYLIAFGVGGLCLLSYFLTKFLLPNSSFHHYVLSVVVGLFCAQFIYQMHGMFEMHFFFFVGSALLIIYQNWKLQLPLLTFIVVHHGTFAYLQYTGMKDVYFTQLEFMDLQTFLFHAVIASMILFINGMWSYILENRAKVEVKTKFVLETQIKTVEQNIRFAEEISKGNLSIHYSLTDEGDNLGKSLLKMQHNLLEASTRERDEKYITQGIATLGDILRKNTDNIDKLTNELIREIVKYTESNQGGIFLLEHDDQENPFLNLSACYAYDRQRFMNKRIEIGDSLVGQSFLEREIIVMTQVPKDYVKITSGLGLATPSCIIIVPLISNEEITGVMELASFTEFNQGKTEFLKKASEAIAASLISVKTTERIKRLLEDSQQRTEELRAQEEEMRQNMEELSATQEEMSRNSSEAENKIQAINESGIASMELALDGTILSANAAFLKLTGYQLSEIQNRHHRILMDEGIAMSSRYNEQWKEIISGEAQSGEFERVHKNGKRLITFESFSSIRDKYNKPKRILNLIIDLSKRNKEQFAGMDMVDS